MGAPYSRPNAHYRRAYVLPSDSFVQCPGGPFRFCGRPHIGPRMVYLDPHSYAAGGRRRYLDPMQYVDRLTGNRFPGGGDVYANGPGVGGMGGFPFPYGGFGGLGWKDPRDWTTRDFECLQEVLGEMLARQRGRRGGRGGRRNHGSDDYGYDGDRGGYDGGGGARGRNNMRDILALLQCLDTTRRLHGVETTVFGTEAQMREAAFRERLYNMLGTGGDRNEYRGIGGGGGNTGARFMQQQRDHERREREQRNLDLEVDEIRRHLERLRDQGGRAGGIGGGGPGGWRSVDEWPFG